MKLVFKVFSTTNKGSRMYNGDLEVYPELGTQYFMPRGWPYVSSIGGGYAHARVSGYKGLRLVRME